MVGKKFRTFDPPTNQQGMCHTMALLKHILMQKRRIMKTQIFHRAKI
jgi:hypothetical protein